MPQIILSTGELTSVSSEDYEYLNQWTWCSQYEINNLTYARRSDYSTGKCKTILMHRIVAIQMSLNIINLQIDHKDRNGLNNQRNNIRVCNQGQNNSNGAIRNNNTSGYKGVSFYKRTNCWKARINYNGIEYFLGYFETPEEAALAYNNAAIRFHGEFAVLNEI